MTDSYLALKVFHRFTRLDSECVRLHASKSVQVCILKTSLLTLDGIHYKIQRVHSVRQSVLDRFQGLLFYGQFCGSVPSVPCVPELLGANLAPLPADKSDWHIHQFVRVHIPWHIHQT